MDLLTAIGVIATFFAAGIATRHAISARDSAEEAKAIVKGLRSSEFSEVHTLLKRAIKATRPYTNGSDQGSEQVKDIEQVQEFLGSLREIEHQFQDADDNLARELLDDVNGNIDSWRRATRSSDKINLLVEVHQALEPFLSVSKQMKDKAIGIDLPNL